MVLDAPALSDHDLMVRVVDDTDPDAPPRTVALAPVVDRRADVSHRDLPDGCRFELIDSTLRPVLSRDTYVRTLARQHAFVGVVARRAGLPWAGAWFRWARDAYEQEMILREGPGGHSEELGMCHRAIEGRADG